MHPTRTTTKLLLSVACAVSAVSGCVNVAPAPMQSAGAPGTTGAPPRHEPRGGPKPAPVEVQAPALEALQALPQQSARPAASAQVGLGPATGASAGTAAAVEAAGRKAPKGMPPVPDIPEPRGAAKPAPGDKANRRDPLYPKPGVARGLAEKLPVRPADVCAMGRKHGRWAPDSPEARICEGVHGG
ncbi:hypothetical protein [Streptomyces sp. BR123]|uniref:hypothetical protein n=1 Tax=Streptomyces sp. BR123 TaxID=2749828 RepID=UPI001C4E8BAB|nr:hypothetical protein [Streptomyces sp. BR123]